MSKTGKDVTISRLGEARVQVLAVARSGRCATDDAATLHEVVWEIEKAMEEIRADGE